MKKFTRAYRLFILCFLLFGVSIFLWNCENEDEKETNTTGIWVLNNYSQRVTLNELNRDKTYLKLSEIFNINNSNFKNQKNKPQRKNTNSFTIDYNYANKVVKENYSSYTFRIKRRTNNINILENLVLENNNGIEEAFILKYQFQGNSIQNIADSNNGEIKAKIWIEYLENYSLPKNKNSQSRSQICRWETVSIAYFCHCEGHSPWEYCECNPSSGWRQQTVYVCQDNPDGTDFLLTDSSDPGGDNQTIGFGGSSGGTGNGDSALIPADTNELQIISTILECAQNNTNVISLSNDQKTDIANFIKLNGCNQNNSDFIDDAIDALINDGEVDFEDKIINKLTGKAKCVYKKLEGSDLMNKTIERFNGASFVNLLIEYGIPTNPQASADTRYDSPIKIRLRKIHIENSPSLYTALVILHEGIHAEIFRKIFNTGGLTYTPPNMYKLNGKRADFPTLFDYYNEYPENPYHNFMADYYRNAIEQGLRDYASQNGLEYPNQLYKDLAWVGLQGTDAWDNMFADSDYTAREQIRIGKSTNKFISSGTNECK